MSGRVSRVSAVAAVLVLAGTLERPLAQQGLPGEWSDVLIAFDRLPGPAEEAAVRAAGGVIRYTYHLVPGIAARMPTGRLSSLTADQRVLDVAPDTLGRLSDAELDLSWGVKRIGAGTAHAAGTTGAGTTVFVLDSGIAWNHPDLAARHAGALSWDFVNGDPDPYDDNGHGTHVAGIIAAADDNAGVVGVAPAGQIASLKVANSAGTVAVSNVIAALQWVVDHGGRVTNSSLGWTSSPSPLLQVAYDAAQAAGVVNLAAAGNSGDPDGTCTFLGDSVEYPARYASVIAVAATNISDGSPCYSSAGALISVSAPGNAVTSTWPGGGYVSLSGTSMASPHVAGLVALMLSRGLHDSNGNGWVSDEARSILQTTATDLGSPGFDIFYGHGLINAVAALAAVVPPPAALVNPDFNGDTKSDLLFENTSGALYGWLMDGQNRIGGAFLSQSPVDPNLLVVGLRDFTGDGKPDLLLQHQTNGTVTLHRLDGFTKTGEQVIPIASGTPWRIVATGDVNNDGFADIVWQHFGLGRIYVWFMKPSGGFAGYAGPGGAFYGDFLREPNQTILTLGATTLGGVGTGDVNGDGRTDLILQDDVTGALRVWYLDSWTVVTQASLNPPVVNPLWKIRAVADYSGDGRPDLVWQHITNGGLYLWILNGASLGSSGYLSSQSVNPIWRMVGPR